MNSLGKFLWNLSQKMYSFYTIEMRQRMVDLDPYPQDIPAMWGLEPTQQNLENTVLTVGGLGDFSSAEPPSSGLVRE